MAYENFHDKVQIVVNGNTYNVDIWNLELRGIPYSGTGSISVKLFDGRRKTRIDGWKIRADFSWDQLDLDQHEVWESILADLEAANGTCTIDFDYVTREGERIGTFQLEDADNVLHAIFDGRGRKRPASISFIGRDVLVSLPAWIVGDTSGFIPGALYYTNDVGVVKMDLDGTNDVQIFKSGSVEGNNIAIDPQHLHDIYIYNDDGEIIRMSRDGANATLIKAAGAGNQRRGLAVDLDANNGDGYIFYFEASSIKRIDADGTNETTIVSPAIDSITGDGMQMFAIDRTNELIYYAENNAGDDDIRVIGYDGTGDALVESEVGGTIKVVHYDHNNGLLYFADFDTLYSLSTSGGTPTTLDSGLNTNLGPAGIDTWFASDKLYLAERSSEKTVKRYTLAGASKTTLITDTNEVLGVVVGEVLDEITYYAIVWVEDDKVMGMTTAGTVTTIYDPGGAPGFRGIATDASGNIYVAARTDDVIIKLDSAGTVLDSDLVGTVNDVYGVSWYEDEIFWSRRADTRVDKQDDDGGGSPTSILSSITDIAYIRVWNDEIFYMDTGDFTKANHDGTSPTTLVTGSASGGGGQVSGGKAVFAEWSATEIRQGDETGAPDDDVINAVEYVDDVNQVIALSSGKFLATDNTNGRIITFDAGGANQQVIYRTTGALRGIAERVHPNI